MDIVENTYKQFVTYMKDFFSHVDTILQGALVPTALDQTNHHATTRTITIIRKQFIDYEMYRVAGIILLSGLAVRRSIGQ